MSKLSEDELYDMTRDFFTGALKESIQQIDEVSAAVENPDETLMMRVDAICNHWMNKRVDAVDALQSIRSLIAKSNTKPALNDDSGDRGQFESWPV